MKALRQEDRHPVCNSRGRGRCSGGMPSHSGINRMGELVWTDNRSSRMSRLSIAVAVEHHIGGGPGVCCGTCGTCGEQARVQTSRRCGE